MISIICTIGLLHICMHACFCREEPLDVWAVGPDTQTYQQTKVKETYQKPKTQIKVEYNLHFSTGNAIGRLAAL